MSALTLDTTQLPPEEMERAYLEYRKACYDIVYRNSVERGVMDLIGTVGYFTVVAMVLNTDEYPAPAGAAALPPKST